MRTGLIAQKMGMTRVFTPEGEDVPVTVLQMNDCQVVAVRTSEKDGYDAVQLGAFTTTPNRLTTPQRDHTANEQVDPKRRVVEDRDSTATLHSVATSVTATHSHD